jgi:hypothetical protein
MSDLAITLTSEELAVVVAALDTHLWSIEEGDANKDEADQYEAVCALLERLKALAP